MEIYVNILNETVTIEGETCNFHEAGLTNNIDPVTVLTTEEEITEALEYKHGEDITITFE